MFADPQKNVEQFGLTPGQKVADLGSGSGFYSLAAAGSVGPKGVVYAVEVQKDLLTKLKNGATKQGLANIELVWGDIEKIGGTKLADGSVDAAILSNVLFQVSDKDATVAEAYRIVKSGGKLLLVDWSESFGGLGPQPEYVIPRERAVELCAKAGFKAERDIQAGSHHYGVIFSK